MKNLSNTLGRNPVYFLSYLVFAMVATAYCTLLGKGEGFQLINRYHTSFLDYFFILFTNIGNGLFIIGLMAFMLIRKKIGWAVQIVISFIFSGLFVQIFKHLIKSPRPKIYFGYENIHYIYGITGTGYSSFPSGHTATIFALTTLLSLYIPGRKSGIFLFIIAALAGLSRIYLSQHFPVDVFAGSGIGVLTSIVVYRFIPLRIFAKKSLAEHYETQSFNLR